MRTSRLFLAVTSLLDRRVGWERLPKPVGLLTLIGLREQLRQQNLAGTGVVKAADPPPPGVRAARTIDGSYNDLDVPAMGSVGTRFGRNVPLERGYPEREPGLLEPNPRRVSRELLARKDFIPARTLNVLAAAWIQFEVHDWFSHDTNPEDVIEVPLPEGDTWEHERPMRVERTLRDPDSGGDGRPPASLTSDSHWWDGSQIYGNTPEFAAAVREPGSADLRLDGSGLPPKDLDRHLDPEGPRGNFWLGLAVLHGLFMREHNAICAALRRHETHLSEDEVYDRARLVNAAVMAKIHTVEWTPALIAHPTTEWGMNANWFGLVGERFARRFGRLGSSDVFFGIPGSPTDHHGAPYSLTEEFVSVYRMHPLIPDEYEFRAVGGDRVLARHDFLAIGPREWRGGLAGLGDEGSRVANALYSLGTANPGAIVLHNFPRFLQDFRPDANAPAIDLGTIDLLRDRERGVPRYNEFRALVHKRPVDSFEEITRDPVAAAELREVYGHVDSLDLMVGLYAEALPRGFAFSDTAFRIFLLMASRRLKSDRFFTRDYTEDVYTATGLAWIRDATFGSILARHHPQLEPVLRGVRNAFAPWNA